MPPLLVASAVVHGTGSRGAAPALRAPAVTAAIGRGLERAGLEPPDLCPLAHGGSGTIEVLLPVVGGETADGYALLEDGGTAITEDRATIAAAAASGAEVLLYCGADDDGPPPRSLPSGPALVVLGGPATPVSAWTSAGARVVPGVTFVLEELGFDERMRAARALVVGGDHLDRASLRELEGEISTRARQAGVPAYAIVGRSAIDRFDQRILDLQGIWQASSVTALEAAGEALGRHLEAAIGPQRAASRASGAH